MSEDNKPRSLPDICKAALNPENYDIEGYSSIVVARDQNPAAGMDTLPRLQDDPPRYDGEDEKYHRMIDVSGNYDPMKDYEQ